MALEDFSGTPYTDTLNASNPDAGDSRTEGDNHLRGIKACIKNTWANITGAVTATHTELNYLDGSTPGTATASNALVTDGSLDINLSTGDLSATDVTATGAVTGATVDGIVGSVTPAAVTGTTITGNTSVVTDTIAEQTATNGVTIDGLSIKDSALGAGTAAQGDVYYGGASGATTKLAKGTADQVLTMNSGATAPEWSTLSNTLGISQTYGSFTGIAEGVAVQNSGTRAVFVCLSASDFASDATDFTVYCDSASSPTTKIYQVGVSTNSALGPSFVVPPGFYFDWHVDGSGGQPTVKYSMLS